MLRVVWTVLLSHCLPLAVATPSALSVLAMSRELMPCRAMSNMRLTTASSGGFGSSFGRDLAPSSTWTFL